MRDMSEIKTFQDLDAWREAHVLVLQMYQETKTFPPDERFGLVSQMRRAVVSVTSNIAEGFSRLSYKEKVRFYYIAHSSLTEIQNQLIISRDVGFLSEESFTLTWAQSVHVHKILNGLIKASRLRF